MAVSRRALASLAGSVALLWTLGALALDQYASPEAPLGSWDAIVVSGAGVTPEGQPSATLAARGRCAVSTWRSTHPRPLLVLTGGSGDEPPAEAIVAADLAVQLGVPEAAMRWETQSTSTDENAQFARELVEGHVLAVSDTYHVFRVRRVYAHYFDRVSDQACVSPLDERIYGAYREVLAVSMYALQGRL